MNGKGAEPAAPIAPGTKAPDFRLRTTPEQTVSPSDFAGQPVILAFYPADWSPVCSDQMVLHQELMPEFKRYNAQLLGISVDGVWCHLAFAKDRNIRFPLLADFEPKGHETAMLAAKATVLLPLVDATLPAAGQGHGLPLCTSGREIARAVLALMDTIAATLPPLSILDSYEKAGAGTRKATLDAMWSELGDATAQVMAEGVRVLAMIWESARIAGGGGSIAASGLKAIDRDDIRARYIDKNFVPSLTLDQTGDVLR